MDDYLIVATLIFGIPSTIVQDLGTISHGLGEDIWTLGFDTITLFAKWFYIMEVLYFFNVAMLKLSLLFFFQRIFPAKPVQKILWGTIVFNIMTGIAFVITAIFQCTPISHYWEKWDGEHSNGTCINVNALGWANAIISILMDVWMLAIPLWQVSRLKMAWRKKISVALMFCVGTFVTIISIIRLQSLITFGTSQNPTWDQADASNWSTIEINVGIMWYVPSKRKRQYQPN
jgi:vacuolar-type H+-ATPase subunit I/STV1